MKFFHFGETVDTYQIPVINEREARAGAGILLLPAIVSFINAYSLHDFLFTKIFITFFMFDFFIRVIINPNYAPTLILGRIAVQNQTPEYVGAAQKRFAWLIGFSLSIIMFVLVVVFEIMTPIKIIICLLCIGLLFFETAFGICLGCFLYYKIKKNTPRYCPGNVCAIKKKEKIQFISFKQILVVIVSIIGILAFTLYSQNDKNYNHSIENTNMKCQAGKCGSNM